MNQNYIIEHCNLIEKRLYELFNLKNIDSNKTLFESMYYSVNAGGKRLRPLLNLLANELLDGNVNETLDIACALEMIHTYSLIHDDLPAMDDDELRRGKPTNHIIYGEAMAILSGDGLLNYAYEILLNNAFKYIQNISSHIMSIKEIATGAGISGMICGQCLDILNEGQIITETELEKMHRKKTGALITASLLSGLYLCHPSETQIEALKIYGDNLGLAFQITDDVLDITGDVKILGKSVGKDKNSKKMTFPALYGVEESILKAQENINKAKEALIVFGNKANKLLELADSIFKREK